MTALPSRVFSVWVFKILGWVCLAALVAAVMFLPGAMALLDQGRLGLDRYQALFYSPSYYITFIEGFTSYTGVGEDCFYGFAPIAILSVFCLFLLSNKKEKSRSVANFANSLCGVYRLSLLALYWPIV